MTVDQKTPSTIQACGETASSFRVNVPSSSEKGLFYDVSGVISQGGTIRCSCPSFMYRGKCKHVEVTEVSCGWRSDGVGEDQTFYQRKGHVCPRCCGVTVNTLGKPLQS